MPRMWHIVRAAIYPRRLHVSPCWNQWQERLVVTGLHFPTRCINVAIHFCFSLSKLTWTSVTSLHLLCCQWSRPIMGKCSKHIILADFKWLQTPLIYRDFWNVLCVCAPVWSEFSATNPKVPRWIPGTTRIISTERLLLVEVSANYCE